MTAAALLALLEEAAPIAKAALPVVEAVARELFPGAAKSVAEVQAAAAKAKAAALRAERLAAACVLALASVPRLRTAIPGLTVEQAYNVKLGELMSYADECDPSLGLQLTAGERAAVDAYFKAHTAAETVAAVAGI